MDVSYVFSGTVGTAKTVLYEVSDNTNQAVGMSILSMSWGAGLILGPTNVKKITLKPALVTTYIKH
jgi:hypothetical protein